MDLKKSRRNIAILQPTIPHYRRDFFLRLNEFVESCDIYITETEEQSKDKGFQASSVSADYLTNIQIKKAVIYNPFKLMNRKYDTMVLPLHIGYFTTYLLLLIKPLLSKKIVLWGHGISIKRYMKERVNPDNKIKWMISKADGIWLYTENEVTMWKRYFPDKPIVALGNTVSGVGDMLDYNSERTKEELRAKYGIKQEIVFIFCARFIENIRRTDLLIDVIERLDSEKYGFIIIGDGKDKPDFSKYKNVYDYGAVYETEKKQELFSAADVYFQPGWVGLSIVEAMAYGLPIFTFERSEEILQCVEYGYIQDKSNGMIFKNVDECITTIEGLSKSEIAQMGNAAKTSVKRNLTTEKMVSNALSIFDNLRS